MHLKWNQTERRFEAELGTGGYKADLDAVKAAGFQTDTTSGWIVWYSVKAIPLKWLRENYSTALNAEPNRPSNITITDEARAMYTHLLPVEENNTKIKAQAEEAKKALKKTLDAEKKEGALHTLDIPAKPDSTYDYIGKEDLPPARPFKFTYTRPTPPSVLCFICEQPIYPYEYAADTNRPACLWCQKIVLDVDELL